MNALKNDLNSSGEKVENLFAFISLIISLAALWVSKKAYDLSIQTKREEDQKALPQIACPHDSFEFDGAYSVAFNIYPGTKFHETESISAPGFEICRARYKAEKNPDGDGLVYGLLPERGWQNEIPFFCQFAPGSPLTEVRVSVRPVPTGPFEVRIQLAKGGEHVQRTVYPNT